MHIPDGYLGPATYAVLDAAIVPVWVMAGARIKRTLKTKQVPLLALASAFSFVIMMFNIPVIGGSTGHAVGAVLVAVLLGPWAAVVAVSIAVVVQAVVFGDGGITAIGANVLNMAVIMPFVGFYLYRLIAGDVPGARRRIVASGIAAYVAMVAAAIAAGFEFGIQPLIAHTAAGVPLYAPYPLQVAVPAMALEHLLFFGWVEALITMGIVAVLGRQEPALLEMRPAARPLRWLWGGLGLLVLATPIGVLAQGTAWGEWSSEQLRTSLGYVPAGLQKLGAAWTAAVPGYAPSFIRDPRLGYLFAAVLGAGLVVGVTWIAGRALSRNAGGSSLARRTADQIARAVGEVFRNEEVASRDGLMQGLDPRVKVASIVLFAVTASLLTSLPALLALIAATLAVAAASGILPGSFSRKVWASAGLFGLLLSLPAATSWITPGHALIVLGPLTITAPGALVAARLICRVAAGAGVGLLVVWTTRYADLLHALGELGLPDVVVSTLAMTQKQIVSLLQTTENMHLARESRMLATGSARTERGWIAERGAFVLRRSLKTADDVYDAMLARGFDGTMPSLARLQTTVRDRVWLVASLGCSVALLLIDRMVLS